MKRRGHTLGQIIRKLPRGRTDAVRGARGGQGQPVAELRPLASPTLSAETLLARWRRLPALDPVALRADIDETLDVRL